MSQYKLRLTQTRYLAEDGSFAVLQQVTDPSPAELCQGGAVLKFALGSDGVAQPLGVITLAEAVAGGQLVYNPCDRLEVPRLATAASTVTFAYPPTSWSADPRSSQLVVTHTITYTPDDYVGTSGSAYLYRIQPLPEPAVVTLSAGVARVRRRTLEVGTYADKFAVIKYSTPAVALDAATKTQVDVDALVRAVAANGSLYLTSPENPTTALYAY